MSALRIAGAPDLNGSDLGRSVLPASFGSAFGLTSGDVDDLAAALFSGQLPRTENPGSVSPLAGMSGPTFSRSASSAKK